jgi:hypothetical protein
MLQCFQFSSSVLSFLCVGVCLALGRACGETLHPVADKGFMSCLCMDEMRWNDL